MLQLALVLLVGLGNATASSYEYCDRDPWLQDAPVAKVACENLPPTWVAGDLRKCWRVRKAFTVPLTLSASTECARHAEHACLIQIPKTGSTTLKTALGLPINSNSKRTSCTSVLAPTRDPLLRFVSGIGTIWHRSRDNIARPSRLNATTFSDYSLAVLKHIERAMTNCSHMGELGSMLHLLPQSTFMSLVCHLRSADHVTPESLLVGPTGGNDLDALLHGTKCAVPEMHRNANEGFATAADRPTEMSEQLLSAVKRVYKDDFVLSEMQDPCAARFYHRKYSTLVRLDLPEERRRVSDGVLRVSASRASNRSEVFRATAARCALHEAPLCGVVRDRVDCQCLPALLGPPRSTTGGLPARNMALIVAGEVRTFLTPALQRYFGTVVDAIRTAGWEPVVLAALGTTSTNPHGPPSLRKGEPRVASIAELNRALRALGADWRLRTFNVSFGWEVHRSEMKNPLLRSLLRPEPLGGVRELISPAGHTAGWLKRAAAFDMLIEYEARD